MERRCHNLGVKIINCSWGGKKFNQALYNTMKISNIFFVCSSGNEGLATGVSPSYPTAFDLPNVISVSAIDNRGELAQFSNYGNRVQIVAPGVNIASTIPGNGYYMLSGTSMATPHVAGVASLILSIDPNFIHIGAYGDIHTTPYLPVIFGNVRKHSISEYIKNGLLDAWKFEFLQKIASTIDSVETLDVSRNKINLPEIFIGEDIYFDIIDDDTEKLNRLIIERYKL